MLVQRLTVCACLVQDSSENGLPCPMCKFVLTQILVQLQDPSNQETILAGALQVCCTCDHHVLGFQAHL